MVIQVPENTPRLNIPKPLGNENVNRVSYNGMIDAIEANAAKKTDVDTHLADNTKHITATERTSWNEHVADNVRHITATERNTWNAKQNALGFTPANVAGQVFTGSVEAPHFNAGQWGQYSSGTNGHVLLGHNCYIDRFDSNRFKFRNTHANLGARGIVFQFIAGVTVPKYFDTGAIATTAGQEFSPSFVDMLHIGSNGEARDVSSLGNWNNVVTTGFYMGTGMTNKPPRTSEGVAGHEWDFVQVIRHNSLWVVQVAHNFNDLNGSYVRRLQNGTWTTWKEVGTVVGSPKLTQVSNPESLTWDTSFREVVDLINLTGPGKLNHLFSLHSWTGSNAVIKVKIIADGIEIVPYSAKNMNSPANDWYPMNHGGEVVSNTLSSSEYMNAQTLSIPFKQNLKISVQYRSNSGSGWGQGLSLRAAWEKF